MNTKVDNKDSRQNMCLGSDISAFNPVIFVLFLTSDLSTFNSGCKTASNACKKKQCHLLNFVSITMLGVKCKLLKYFSLKAIFSLTAIMHLYPFLTRDTDLGGLSGLFYASV